MGAQFTPGPWEAVNDQGWRVWGDRSRGSTPIATIAWADNRSVSITSPEAKAETEANARLVAAAPELLAAAEIVMAGLNARIEAAPSSAVPVFDGIADLHSAIAKARGETA